MTLSFVPKHSSDRTLHVCMYICIYVYIYIYVLSAVIYTYIYIYIYLFTYLFICTIYVYIVYPCGIVLDMLASMVYMKVGQISKTTFL